MRRGAQNFLTGCSKTPICCVSLILRHCGVRPSTPHSSGSRGPCVWAFLSSLRKYHFSRNPNFEKSHASALQRMRMKSQINSIFFLLFTLSDDRSFIFRKWRWNRPARNLRHRSKSRGANFKASSAFYAFLLINYMDLVLCAEYRLYRASLRARHTGLTLFRVDIVRDDFTE